MLIKNLFSNFPDVAKQERIEEFVKDGTVRIERIVSYGQASLPDFWYDQEEHEWVVVLAGEGSIQWKKDGTTQTLKSGDSLFIPSHTQHRVAWTKPNAETVWLAVYWKS